MTVELESLIVSVEAKLDGMERALQKAVGLTNKQATAMERRVREMTKRMDASTADLGKMLIPSLGAIGAALTTGEVLRYADAWKRAKNALAVAGVVGAQQADILGQLYDAAQRNGAPLEALTTLYGRAAQVSKELGASQSDLIRFTDGVATALRVAGSSPEQASGALLQLSQALGSARVMAEEFNSVNEGARPVLQAVAAGLDAAGGSVAKLKQLVIDGKVSNTEFFQSFLNGLPTIQGMAANAAQTIDQAVTKVTNALTKYIGETDSSLGMTSRLISGLNALADNFDKTADIVLMFAGVVAGGLLGRSMASMVASLGLGAGALTKFTAAVLAAKKFADLRIALGGLSQVAGPVGLLIGGAVAGAVTYFAAQAEEAAARTERVQSELARLGIVSEAAVGGINAAGAALEKLAPEKVLRRLRDFQNEIDRLKGRAGGLNQMIVGAGPLSDIATKAGDIAGAASLFGSFSRFSSTDRDAATRMQALATAALAGRQPVAEIGAELDRIGALNLSAPVSDLVAQLRSAVAQLDQTERGAAALMRQSDTASAVIEASAGDARSALGDLRQALSDLSSLPGTAAGRKRKAEALEGLISGLAETSDSVIAVQAKLADLASGDPGYAAAARRLQPLLDKLAAIYKAGETARESLADLSDGPVTARGANGAFQRQRAAAQKIAVDVLDESGRIAALTDAQKALEDEIARLTKAVQDAGGIVDKAAIQRQATANVAASAAKRQVTTMQAPIDVARRFDGYSEGSDAQASALKSLFAQGAGISLDPQTTAWCAAFASAAIGLAGGKPPKYTAAKDFLGYGTATDQPKVGDLVVMKNHVGFYEGDNGDGTISVYGGNQSNSVKSSNFAKSGVLGYRSIDGAPAGSDDSVERILAQADATRNLEQATRDLFAGADQQIAQMQQQAAAQQQSTYEAARAYEQQRLLQQAQADSIPITDDLRSRIDAQAEAYGRAAQAAEDMGLKFQQSQQLQQFIGGELSGFFSGIISGSQSAEQALQNVVSALADAALQAALLGQGPLAGLFGTATSNGAVGGLIGSLFSGFGFADGGYTGAGGRNQPAGVVHRGEVVWSQADVRRAGGIATVEAMRRGLSGYAAGGVADVAIPAMPRMPTQADVQRAAAARNGVATVTYAPQIDARGADVAAVARLERAMAQDRAAFASNVVRVVGDARGRRVL